MSLDVYLTVKKPVKRSGTGVFIRDKGGNRELTPKEIAARWPGTVVAKQKYSTNEVYSANITHNLNKMATKAGIYEALWRPEEKGWSHAKDIEPVLEAGLLDLLERPEHYKKFNSDNGWGTYDQFVAFVKAYWIACIKYPDAEIEVSR